MEPAISGSQAVLKKISVNSFGVCVDVQLDSTKNTQAIYLTHTASGFKLLHVDFAGSSFGSNSK